MINKKVIVGKREQKEIEFANSIYQPRERNQSNEAKPTPRVISLVEDLKKKQRRWDYKKDQLASKSKSRMDGWIQGQTNSESQVTDSQTLIMLNGLYRSQNPNLHDFRQPVGKLTSVGYYQDESMMEGEGHKRSSGYMFNSIQNDTMQSSKIVKPLDFTTLKGHTIDKVRALRTQERFQKDFIVSQGNNFYRKKDNRDGKGRMLGQDFRTSFKKFDDCSRVQ